MSLPTFWRDLAEQFGEMRALVVCRCDDDHKPLAFGGLGTHLALFSRPAEAGERFTHLAACGAAALGLGESWERWIERLGSEGIGSWGPLDMTSGGLKLKDACGASRDFCSRLQARALALESARQARAKPTLFGSPALARWLTDRMNERDAMTVYRFHKAYNISKATVNKVRNGKPVTAKSLKKILLALAEEGAPKQLSFAEMPAGERPALDALLEDLDQPAPRGN